jgi:hypothetical protein
MKSWSHRGPPPRPNCRRTAAGPYFERRQLRSDEVLTVVEQLLLAMAAFEAELRTGTADASY